MEKKVKLLPPSMPNFIFIEQPPKPRDQPINGMSIPVSSLSEEEAEQYGQLMKETFIAHAAKKRIQQPDKSEGRAGE